MHISAWLSISVMICAPLALTEACGSDATTGNGNGGAVGTSGSPGNAAGTSGNAAGTSGSAAGTSGNAAGTSGGGGNGAGASGSAGTASGSGARPGGSGGVPSGTGGADSSCPPECLVENQCVKSCGQTPMSYGCCPCPQGMVNARTCGTSMTDAGSSGSVSCDTRKVLCKRATPVCPDGQVPSVAGSCYGDCVPIDSCTCGAPDECPNSNEYTCHMSMRRCGPYV